MEPIKILLADDHVLFRRGIVSILADHPQFEVVGEVGNGLQALDKARELMPDLILMDINMPICDGLEATRWIKGEMPYVKIVMLTVSDDQQSLFEAIKSGAGGYLLKNLEPDALVDYLLGVSKGEAPISRTMAARILDEFARLASRGGGIAGTPQEGDGDREQQRLTGREKEVLQLVSEGATNKEIAVRLGIAENTVKNHLRNILEKLHLQNRAQAAAYAVRKGLLGDARTGATDRGN